LVLRLDEIDSEGRGSGAWRIPPRRAFAESDLYDLLQSALKRYTQGQTAGRSFLLAGHRGAGKTALVEQIILDLKWDAIEQVAAGRQGAAPCRPFLVKLHGPSLITPVSREPPTDGGAGDGAVANGGAPATGAALAEDTAQQALIQITLALYRAFAEEVAWGFALHARAEAERTGSDQIELAGQLNLDLDLAPDAGLLRQYWKRLRRLGAGVAWPDPPITAKLPPDQGVREIVAIATAGQAFRVCAGKSEIKEENAKNDEHQQALNSKGAMDVKDVLNKLSGLVAGLSVGGLLKDYPEAAIPAALAAGLLTNLSFSWSDTRNRTRKQSATYTFIRNTSTPTLDRELPLAINRIKAAGLVPVFVIDELDKVPDSAERVKGLLRRLKHIVTDYGFFCFLTDRDCFDLMKVAVDGGAYPVEHTFFSDRLFLSYSPLDLLNHLLVIIKCLEAANPTVAGNAQVVLALETLLHARPHFIDVNRRLTRACDHSGALRVSLEDLGTPRYLLAASFQLAIQLVFLDPEIQSRIAEDVSFQQWLVDTLYWPVSVWERDKRSFEPSMAGLRQHLIDRASVSGEGDAKRQEALDKALDDGDLDYLQRRLMALLELLADFSKLRAELGRLADRLPPDLANALPNFTQALVEVAAPGGGGSGLSFRFLFDVRGYPVIPADAPIRDPNQRIDTALAFVNALLEFGRKLYLPLDLLTQVNLLPARYTARSLGKTRAHLMRARSSGVSAEETERRLTQIDELSGVFNTFGGRLADFLLLACHANIAAGHRPRDLRQALRAIVRIHGLEQLNANLKSLPEGLTPPAHLGGTRDSLIEWQEFLLSAARLWASLPAATDRPDPRVYWETWRRRFTSDRTPENFAALSFDELVEAVAGRAPARLFRADLRDMTLGEWSDIVLHFASPEAEAWPLWLLVVALIRLGAPRPIQEEILQGAAALRPTTSQLADVPAAKAMIRGGDGPPGTLLLIDDDSPALAWPIEGEDFVLALRRSDYPRYATFIDRLVKLKAFDALAQEDNG
jgi:hypothetical protein